MAIKNRKKGNQPKVFIGILNDAGGFIISVDVWGRPHIRRVPPRQPDVERLTRQIVTGVLFARQGRQRPRSG